MFDAIDARLAPGNLVIFGEMHGTMEAPAFVAAAAEYAAPRGPVTLALELPDQLQPALERYLRDGDVRALRATPSYFWDFRDGRGGPGLLALLDRMRAIGAAIHCFDGTYAQHEVDQRDRIMAERLLAAFDPRRTWLALCGNVHAMIDSPRTMAWHVRQRLPQLVALTIKHDGGSAFGVRNREPGRVYELGTPTGDARRGVVLYGPGGEARWHGEFHVGALSPSPPLE